MHELCEKYKLEIKSYEDFREKIEGLIREIMINKEIPFHKIESRVKDPLRLDEKIQRKDGKYNSLDEITDLVGIRVITYFEDIVDVVADAIEIEFDLDNDNSIDKRKLDIDRFGYKSLHYVVSLKSSRQEFIEYKRFGSKKVEIQIRSILQHAWAEIEHDLGYKSKTAVPGELQRDFYLAAAFLEKADKDFVLLRKQLTSYENNVPAAIESHPEDVDINAASLKSYILTNPTVLNLDQQICKLRPITKLSSTNLMFAINRDIITLYELNINTIKKLDECLYNNADIIIEFARLWVQSYKHKASFTKGICIFYLCYIVAAQNWGSDRIQEYYVKILKSADPVGFGKKVISTYESATAIL